MFSKGKRFDDASNSSGTVPGPGDYNPVDLNSIQDRKEPRTDIQRFHDKCDDSSGMHAPRSLVNLVTTSGKSDHLSGSASSTSLRQNRPTTPLHTNSNKPRATFDHHTKGDRHVHRQRGASCDNNVNGFNVNRLNVNKEHQVQPRVPTHVCEPRLARERPKTLHVFNESPNWKSEVSSKVPSHILSPKSPTHRATTTTAAASSTNESRSSTSTGHSPRATTYSPPRENRYANPGRSLESQSSSKMYNRQRDLQSAFGVRSDSTVDSTHHKSSHQRPDEGQQKRSKRPTSFQSPSENRDILKERCKSRPSPPVAAKPAAPPRVTASLRAQPTRISSNNAHPAAVEYSNDEAVDEGARSVVESDFGFTSTTTFDIGSDECSDKDTVIPNNITPPSERDAELCDENDEIYVNYVDDSASTTSSVETPRQQDAASRDQRDALVLDENTRVREPKIDKSKTKPKEAKESLRSKREDAAFEKFVNKSRKACKSTEPVIEPIKLSAVASRRRMRNAFVSEERVKTTLKQRAHDAAVKSKLVEVTSPPSLQPVERLKKPVKTMLWYKRRVLVKKPSKKSLGKKSNSGSGGSTRRSARRASSGKLQKITHLEMITSEEIIADKSGDFTELESLKEGDVYVQEELFLSNSSSYASSLGGDSCESIFEDASQEIVPQTYDDSSELVQLYTRADSNRRHSDSCSDMKSDMEITVNTEPSGYCVDICVNNLNTNRKYSTRDDQGSGQSSIENRSPRKKLKINVADNSYRSRENIRKYRLRDSRDSSELEEEPEDELGYTETSVPNDEVELNPGSETAITWKKNEVITIDSTTSKTSVFLQSLDKASKSSLMSNQTSSTQDSNDSRRQLVIKGGNRRSTRNSPKHSYTSAERKISRNLMLQREKGYQDDEHAAHTRSPARPVTQPVKVCNASSRRVGRKEEPPVSPKPERRVGPSSVNTDDRIAKEGEKSSERNVKINTGSTNPKSKDFSVEEEAVPKSNVSSPNWKASPCRQQSVKKQIESPSHAASKTSSKGNLPERESSSREILTCTCGSSSSSQKEVTNKNIVQNEAQEKKSSIHDENDRKEKVSQISRDQRVEKVTVCQKSVSPTRKPNAKENTSSIRTSPASRKSTDRERRNDSSTPKAENGRESSVSLSSRSKSSIESEKVCTDRSSTDKRSSNTSSRKSSVSPPPRKSSGRTPKRSVVESNSSDCHNSSNVEKGSKSNASASGTPTFKKSEARREDPSLATGVSSIYPESICHSTTSSSSFKSSTQSLDEGKQSSTSSATAERDLSSKNDFLRKRSISGTSHKSTNRPQSLSKGVANESTISERTTSSKNDTVRDGSVATASRKVSPRTKTAPITSSVSSTVPDRAASDKVEIVRKISTSPHSRKNTVVLSRKVRDESSTSSTSPERAPKTKDESVYKRNVSSRKSNTSIQSRKRVSNTSLINSKSAGIVRKSSASPTKPNSRVQTGAVSKRNPTSSTSPKRASQSENIRKSSVSSSCKSDVHSESVGNESKSSVSLPSNQSDVQIHENQSSRASSERAASVSDQKDTSWVPLKSPRSIVKFQKEIPKRNAASKMSTSGARTKQEIVQKSTTSPSSTKSSEQNETASRKSLSTSSSPERVERTKDETVRKASMSSSSCKSDAQSKDVRKTSRLSSESSKPDGVRKSSVTSSCKSGVSSRDVGKERTSTRSLEHESSYTAESGRKSSVTSSTSHSSSVRTAQVRKQSLPQPEWNSSTRKESPRKSSASPASKKSSLLSQKSRKDSPVSSGRSSSLKDGSVSPGPSRGSSIQSTGSRKDSTTSPEIAQSPKGERVRNRSVSTSSRNSGSQSQKICVESLPSSSTSLEKTVEKSPLTMSRKTSVRSEADRRDSKPSSEHAPNSTVESGRRSNASSSSRKSSKDVRQDSSPATERQSSTNEGGSRKSSTASQPRRSSVQSTTDDDQRSTSPDGSGSYRSECKRKGSTSSQAKSLRTQKERDASRRSSKSSFKSVKQTVDTDTHKPLQETVPSRSHTSLDDSWESATSITDDDSTHSTSKKPCSSPPTSCVRHLDDAEFEELQRGAQSVIAYISETVADIEQAAPDAHEVSQETMEYKFEFPLDQKESGEMVLKFKELKEEKEESSDDTLVLSPGSREKLTKSEETLDEFESVGKDDDSEEATKETSEEGHESVDEVDVDTDNRTNSSMEDTGSENLDFLGQEEPMLDADSSWKNVVYEEKNAMLDRVYLGDLASSCKQEIIVINEIEENQSSVIIEEIEVEESQDDGQSLYTTVEEESDQGDVISERKVPDKSRAISRKELSREEIQFKKVVENKEEILKASRIEELMMGEVQKKSHGDEVEKGHFVSSVAVSPEVKETVLAMGDIGSTMVIAEHATNVADNVVDEMVSCSGSTASFVSTMDMVDNAIMKNIKEFIVADLVAKKSREMLDVIVEEEELEEKADQAGQVVSEVENIYSYDNTAALLVIKQKDAEISRLLNEIQKLRLKCVSIELSHDSTSAELVRLRQATKETIAKLHDQVDSLQESLSKVAAKALESERSLLQRIDELENETLEVTYQLAEETEKRIDLEEHRNEMVADVSEHCDVLIDAVRTPSEDLHLSSQQQDVLTELRTLRILQKTERLELERLRRDRDVIADRLKKHEMKVAEISQEIAPPLSSIEKDVKYHHQNICDRFGKIVDLKAEMKENEQMQTIRRHELQSTVSQAQLVEEALLKVSDHKDWFAKFKLEQQLRDLEALSEEYMQQRRDLEAQLFTKEMQLHVEEQMMMKQYGPLHTSKMLCDFERTLRLKRAGEDSGSDEALVGSDRTASSTSRGRRMENDGKREKVLEEKFQYLQGSLQDICGELLRMNKRKKKIASRVDKMASCYTASLNRRLDQEHRVDEIQEICEKRCRHVGYGRPAISWDSSTEEQEPVCIDLYRDLSHLEFHSSEDSLGSDESAESRESRQSDTVEYVY